jgi:hypothetical protein
VTAILPEPRVTKLANAVTIALARLTQFACRPSEQSDEFAQASHQLPVALVDIDAKLGNEGVGECEMRQSIRCNRELADTDDPQGQTARR